VFDMAIGIAQVLRRAQDRYNRYRRCHRYS
jgi:hypothetical protein